VAYSYLDGMASRVRRRFVSDERVREMEVERRSAGLQLGEGD
jgi:hypothetical protein